MKRIPFSRSIAVGIVALGGQALGFAETGTSSMNSALPDAGFSVLRVFGALSLVLALFFGGVWLFKNWQAMLARKGNVAKLTVLEVRSLGNRHALYVVGYERLRLLLASSPSGINLVSSLPEAAVEASTAARPSSFPEALQKVLDRTT
jgi:flagellar biogenesis protein FliO